VGGGVVAVTRAGSERVAVPGRGVAAVVPGAVLVGVCRVSGLVRYFKSAEMLVLLYEKWRYGYPLSYEVLD
jgi:hypothetical protein